MTPPRALVLLLGLAMASCQDPLAGLTGIAVTVRPCGNDPVAVMQIQLTLVPASGEPETQIFEVSGHALPVRVTASLPDSRAGRYGVEVRALGQGELLAEGRTEVSVARGIVEPTIVQVCSVADGGPADGGPADGGDGADDVRSEGDEGTDGGAGERTQSGDEPPACAEGRAQCGPDCVDLGRDSEHCGGCDRSCLGTACREGRCDPVVVATEQREPSGIAHSQGTVCWSNRGTAPAHSDGEVRCWDTATAPESASSRLAGDLSAPVGLVAVGGSVYWVEAGAQGSPGSGRLVGSPIEQPLPSELAIDQGAPRALTASADTVYWVNSAAPFELRSISTAGRTEGLDLSGEDEVGRDPAAVAVDEEHVYWLAEATGTTSGSLRRLPRNGGAVEILAVNLSQPRALVLGREHVYVASFGSTEGADGSLVRLEKEAPSVAPREIEVLASAQAHPVAVVADAQTLYWANAGPFDAGCSCYPQGTISKVALTGGEPVTLVQEQLGIVGLTLDEVALYWASAGSPTERGAIWRVAR